MKKTLIIRILIILSIISFGLYLAFSLSWHEGATSKDLTAFINTNSDSNVAIVIKAKNGEGMVVFTDSKKTISRIVINSPDGKNGIIQVNKDGQPTQLDFDGTTAVFENYTEKTVDISVKRKNGEVEVFKNSSITAQSISFIPSAIAYSVSEYMSGVGTAINVVSCGVGLGSILFSGGATSPLAYLGCASLTTRVVTLDTEIGPCKGDILDCAKDAILGSLIEEAQKNGPDFLKNGFRLKWNLRNSISGKPITKGIILIDNISNGKKGRGEVTSDSYEIYIQDSGVYSARVVLEGFSDGEFNIILTQNKAQIRTKGQKLALEKSFDWEDYIEMKTDLFIDPDAFIIGEIIDAVEGSSISGAKISLLDDKTIVDNVLTESDGMFTLHPPMNSVGKNYILSISVNGYKSKDIPIYISYDVKEKSNEYIIDNWNGVIKLEPNLESTDESDFTGLWDGQIMSSRTDNRNEGFKQFICDQTVFAFKVIKIKSGKFVITGSLGVATLNTTEKQTGIFDRIALNLDENGNIEFTSRKFPIEGNLSSNTGSGTWSHMVVLKKEKYELCGGTWSAKKVK